MGEKKKNKKQQYYKKTYYERKKKKQWDNKSVPQFERERERENKDTKYMNEKIERCNDESVLEFIEQHIHLLPLAPRPGDYDVISGSRTSPELASNLARAADDCWEAM